MADASLDFVMSPSQYSRRRSSEVIVDYHLQYLTDKTKEARCILKSDLGVKCSPDGPDIDLYYPEETSNAESVVIYLHGGYWQALSLDHSGWLGIQMTKNNIIYTAIGYDIAPKVNMTTIVKQCRVACAFIAKKFPDKRLYIAGHSAGGHLAAIMLITDWSEYGLTSYPFKGAILLSGVYDLVPVQNSYVNDPLQLTDEEVIHYSPLSEECSRSIFRIASNGVQCLLAEGEQETPVFKEQRQKYLELLRSKGVDCTFHEIMDEDHFSLMEKLYEPDYSLTKICLEHIKNRRL